MKILLDTHILILAAIDKLPEEAVRYIADESNTLLFSTASIWEIMIKNGLGRKDFAVDPMSLYNGLLMAEYTELPVTSHHVLRVKNLPSFHKDPFGRILLAQAAYEGVAFLTADKEISKYPGSIIFVG